MAEPQRYDEFLNEALYGARGFYELGGRPGSRDGDFATSVELGPLFADCVAAYLDRVWVELGRPDPFVVIEGGAGRGTLCSDVLRVAADCSSALRYVMVERVASARNDALERVGVVSANADVPVAALSDLPAGPFEGVVLANELLDNLPFRLLERTASGWLEVHVRNAPASPVEVHSGSAPAAPAEVHPEGVHPEGVRPGGASAGRAEVGSGSETGGRVEVRPGGASGGLVEVLVDAPSDAAAMADALAADAPIGARIPLQLRASVWVRRAQRLLSRGRVLVFDYGVRTTVELARRPTSEWLRTYRSQRRADDPLSESGSADITCEVAFDQLPPGANISTQAEWLAAAGLEETTAGARALWERDRHEPTAQTLAARAMLDEAAALADPHSFGAFWVADWHAEASP